MSLVSEETPPGLLYLPTSSPQSVPTPQGDYSRPETTTASLSPPQQQAGGQKTGTVTGMVCAVCSEISSKETTFRKHYGVICCEACKCFFRRTVQMSRDYKCRYDGRCTIGRFPEIMKQVCQACRFTQCLRAGMKIESVKKFPRKAGKEGKQSGDSDNSDTTGGGDQAKFQKVLKNFSKGKRRAKSAITGGGWEEETSTNGTLFSPRPKQVKAESETDVDSDLKFSPCHAAVMSSIDLGDQSIVYSLPGGGGVANGESGVPHSTPTPAPEGGGVRITPQDPHILISKKMRLESTLSQLRPLSPPLSAVLHTSLSPPPFPQSAPYTPPSFQHAPSAHYHHHPYSSHPGSVLNSPESHPPSVYNSHANTPYATPHATPHGTPIHSPLPSPTAVGPAPSSIHPPPLPQYPPHSSLLSLPTFTRHNNLLFSQSPVFLNSSQQVPFRVLPVAQPLLPFMASFPSFQPQVQSYTNEIAPGPSPFSIIPIPSSTTPRFSRPTQMQPQQDEGLPQPSLPPPETGDVEEPPPSAPPSTRTSPEPSFKTSSMADGGTFPEAEVDEVLDSLRQRIRKMFSWAKSDVAGFEDLSPLDQKALLRRTVAELVMLGFARASIAYDGMYCWHTNRYNMENSLYTIQ
jgi:hypothetical protein